MSLFPNAVSVEGGREVPMAPDSFLLREKQELFWVHVASRAFSRSGICDYLARARQIQSNTPSSVHCVLMAPDFEPGALELLELAGIPIRFFRYREAVSITKGAQSPKALEEPALFIEELGVALSTAALSSHATRDPKAECPSEFLSSTQTRLSREELREFIQFELDVVGWKYKS